MKRKSKRILACFLATLLLLISPIATYGYELTDEERDLLGQAVMAEASPDFYGQALIAEAALNTTRYNGWSISQVIENYGWTNRRVVPSESCEAAIKAVFDYGYSPSNGGGITIFYNPSMLKEAYSAFHESQVFVIEHCGVRFFQELKFQSLVEGDVVVNYLRRAKIDELIGKTNMIVDAAESIMDDEQEAFDNLPEGIQDSDRGEVMEKAIENLEAAIDSLNEAIEYFEAAKNGE